MDKIRVDATDMTLGELAEATELAGGDENRPGFNFRQTAAMACIVKRRTDPTFTFEDALRLKMSDLDLVEEPPPEAPGGEPSGPPPLSLASGTSTPNAS